eukprot:g22951.t1
MATDEALKVYKESRNELKQAIRRAKRGHEKSFTNRIKENPEAFYRYIKSKRVARLKDKGGNLHVEPEEVHEVLNKYFVLMFAKEKKLVEDDIREESVKFLSQVAIEKEEVLY